MLLCTADLNLQCRWAVAGQEQGPHGPSRFSHQAAPSHRFQRPQHQDPPSPDQVEPQSGVQVTPPARGHSQSNDAEVQSSSKRHCNSAEPSSVATVERRAAADREFARLQLEGAPADARYV